MIPATDSPMDSEMKCSNEYIDLEHYRKLVRTYIDLRRYKTALFWAEKVVNLSQYDPVDVYWQAQCMFLLNEYHRAAHIIKLRGYEKTNMLCHYLAAECHYEAKDLQEAMELMNSLDLDYVNSTLFGNNENAADIMFAGLIDGGGPSKAEVMASICLLRGKVLEAMDNRTLAMDCYVQALHLSVYCTEALDGLVQHEMLLASEEKELISHLPFDQQCTESEAKVLKKLYKSKLKKYCSISLPISVTQAPIGSLNTIKTIIENSEKTVTDRANTEIKRGINSKFFSPIEQNTLTPANKIYNEIKTTPTYSIQTSLSKHGTPSGPNSGGLSAAVKQHNEKNRNKDLALSKTGQPLHIALDRLDESIDVMAANAEALFYNSDYKKCTKLLDTILKNDPYHTGALTVYIGSLMELKENNKLFCIAHKLVDLYSDQAISWYAVGCYYDLIGKSDPARRYLTKATSIDRLFGPAWLAYGHSFAKENEHDQAMAAYFKAAQLMRGCHLPLLYIGVECGLTKNLDLAEKFFYQAMSVAPLDVHVLHELGVIKFEYEFYKEAEDILRATLGKVTKLAENNNESISPSWEPLLNNLGHACRKNKKYDEALSYHKQALVLKPQSAHTYTALGFVYALKGNLETAVEYLHRSLALRRDDIVTSTLLKLCLEELMDDLPSSILDANDQSGHFTIHPPQSAGPRPNIHSIGEPSPSIFDNRPIILFPPVDMHEANMRCMKITFDEDSNNSQSSEVIDNSIDMSMDD